MTTITYLTQDRETKTFDIELPQSIYCRINLQNNFDFAGLSANDFINDPKDMYYYQELLTADSPLFSFIVLYRQEIILNTEEIDLIFDEVVTYNDIYTTYNEETKEYTFDTVFIDRPPVVQADDYVPPITSN